MRRVAAAGLALPVLAFVYASAFLRRSIVARLAVLGVAAALVVTGLAVGLAPKQIEARGPSTFAPLSPSSYTVHVQAEQALTAPVSIEFSNPMNEGSVARGFSIAPATPVDLSWDSLGQTLTIAPKTHWSATAYYTVTVPGTSVDRAGIAIGQPVHMFFVTAQLPHGTISATVPVGDQVSPVSGFKVVFDTAVPAASIREQIQITPSVIATVSGDDPNDQFSRVFTVQPLVPLDPGTSYTVSLAPGGVDQRGVPLGAVAPLTVTTVSAPDIVRFRPVDKATNIDPSQPVSARFTMPMDTTVSTAAFTVTADGKAVKGATRWAEEDTVLVFTPSAKFAAGAKVELAVSTAARAKSGAQLPAQHLATFTVAKPAAPAPTPAPTATPTKKTTPPTTTVKPITPPTGGGAIGSAPWLSAEQYYFRLMNCTRTGGWVTSSGSCSSSTRHTLPRAAALMLDGGISSRVARPFAKFMADRGILNHFADGSPATRLARAGYTSYQWGENIASPTTVGQGGMISVEIFFQNEAPCRCDHYANIMNPRFDRVGVGVWVTSGRVRVVADFYHP